jgi:hypothetical protein
MLIVVIITPGVYQFFEGLCQPIDLHAKKEYYKSVTAVLRLPACELKFLNSNGQTHREMGAQSYGSAREKSADRQTAEGDRFGSHLFSVIVNLKMSY